MPQYVEGDKEGGAAGKCGSEKYCMISKTERKERLSIDAHRSVAPSRQMWLGVEVLAHHRPARRICSTRACPCARPHGQLGTQDTPELQSRWKSSSGGSLCTASPHPRRGQSAQLGTVCNPTRPLSRGQSTSPPHTRLGRCPRRPRRWRSALGHNPHRLSRV